MVDSTTSLAASSVTNSIADKVNASAARLADSEETFLKLLTTQLKNQDPLSPLDSNQFTQQIVQMTGVEQQLLTNDLLKKLVSNTGSGVSTAVSLIGKEVRADADVTALANGKAD
ncbi:MAG TPA: flagellar hook capping FlgD N-terminal domain-containing protein, partial [Caulobacteraceae bacterium]|nr:flagellar hook capping FlgD N-terminal domain-containing protein [Caulobacteraceae bacterium]